MGRLDWESETLIPTIGGGFDVADPLKTRGGNHAGHADSHQNGGGHQAVAGYLSARAIRNSDSANELGIKDGDVHDSLQGDGPGAVAFDLAQITSKTNRSRAESGLPASTLNAESQMHVATVMQVRRLTPLECERLQGFPDGWTDIPYNGKPAKDGPRYKALGNSMAVNCMRWLGERIASVESIQ